MDANISFRVDVGIKKRIASLAQAFLTDSSDVVRAGIRHFLDLPEKEQLRVIQLYLSQQKGVKEARERQLMNLVQMAEAALELGTPGVCSMVLTKIKKIDDVPSSHKLAKLIPRFAKLKGSNNFSMGIREKA